MKFRKLKSVLFRIKLIFSNFYEDITFADKIVKKNVKSILAKWMFYLANYKEIRIGKFKELFSELNEIVFPIQIKDCYGYDSLDILIIDNEGKEYYMSKRNTSIYGYNEVGTYIIRRRNSSLEPLVDRDFHYEISEEKNIVLRETGAMRLKPDGTSYNVVVDFCFDSQKHTTEARLHSYTSSNTIKLCYPTMACEFDTKVLNFLFDINENNFCYYDVFPILKWLLLRLPNEGISLSITTEVEEEICSEIDVVNGIVHRYIKTEITSEGGMKTSKVIFYKKLEDFLAENS